MSAANLYKASFEQDALTTACSLMTRSVFVFMYSFIHVYDFLWAAVHDLDRDLVGRFSPRGLQVVLWPLPFSNLLNL